MRRLSTLLFLSTSLAFCAWGQPENDLCTDAILLPLGQVMTCPDDSPAESLFDGSTQGATPTQQPLRLSSLNQGASLNGSGRDVWYRFSAIGNHTTVFIEGELEHPTLVLFQGDACNNQFPVAFQSGASPHLSVRTEPGENYYLLVGSAAEGEEGDFSLRVQSQNDCSDCGERRGWLTAQPAPLNGAYESGQEVTFCYTPAMWAPGFSLEWLHGIDISFGAGWDLSALQTNAPTGCTAPDGTWSWYDSWESCNTNASYGPGFAFDSKRGLLCPGSAANDGMPGNNFGDGPCGSLAPMPLDLEFCWTVKVKSAFSSPAEANLNLSIQMLGDGNSGSWMMSSCAPEETTAFYATAVPPLNMQPDVSVVQPACPGLCNGQISLSGGSSDGFSLFDENGALLVSSSVPVMNTTVNDLCPGNYQFVVQNGSDVQAISVQVPAVDLPDLSAGYLPACFEGAPYQLEAQVSGASTNINYQWTGPGGFSSVLQNPTAPATGPYVLDATYNDCPLPEAVVEVQSVLPEVNCSTTENSIHFSWQESPGDTAYFPTVLSGQPGQLTGSQSFVIHNLNPGESATLELAVEGSGACPLKIVEKTCATNFCPPPDPGPDTLLCGNSSLQLSIDAPPDAIINWSPAAGLSCTDCPNPVAAPVQTTTYQVTVSDPLGCVGSDAITVYIDEFPGDAFPDNSVLFCPGEPFSLCLPEGNNYLWISPIGFIQTGDCLVYPYTSTSIAGNYTVRVRLPNGCRITEAIELAVDPACNSFSAPAIPATQSLDQDLLRAYPNPARQQVLIRTTLPGPKSINLKAANGQVIKQWEQTALESRFDLSGLQRGVYFIELVGESSAARQLLFVQ